MGTNLNGYEPTAAETKLLEVLSNPENATKSITDICNQAGVTRKTYYALMKKPEFVNYKNEMIKELLNGKISNVLNATYKFAVSDSKCAQDRKILLSMSGLYTDKQETKIELTGNIENPLKDLSLDEIKELLNKKEENE